jgi:hypothetical protein
MRKVKLHPVGFWDNSGARILSKRARHRSTPVRPHTRCALLVYPLYPGPGLRLRSSMEDAK